MIRELLEAMDLAKRLEGQEKARAVWERECGKLQAGLEVVKAELETAKRTLLHPCPVCEQPCNCRFPGAEGEDCECKNCHELEDRAEGSEEACDDARVEADDLRAGLESTKAKVQEAEAANRRLSDEVQRLTYDNPEVEKLRGELESERTRVDDYERLHQADAERIAYLEKERDELRSRLEAAEQNAKAAEELAEQRRQRAKDAEEELAQLRGKAVAANRRPALDRAQAIEAASAVIEGKMQVKWRRMACDIVDAILSAKAEPAKQERPPAFIPCTGVEFTDAAQAAMHPRTDDEVREAIADVEQVHVFVPSPTDAQPSEELVERELPKLEDFDGRLRWLLDHLDGERMGRPEVEAIRRSRDHAKLAQENARLAQELSATKAAAREEAKAWAEVRGNIAEAVGAPEGRASLAPDIVAWARKQREEVERLARALEERTGILGGDLNAWVNMVRDVVGMERGSLEACAEALDKLMADRPACPADGMPRVEVLAFALVMEEKLKANDHKIHWGACEPGYLRRRLHDEVGELCRALDKHRDTPKGEAPAVIANEAADVANFAMMLADNCGGLDLAKARELFTPGKATP